MLASAGLLGSAPSLLPSFSSWVFGWIAPVPVCCQRQPACLKAAWIISLTSPLCPSPLVVVDFDMHFVDCMFFACSVECRRLGLIAITLIGRRYQCCGAHGSGGSELHVLHFFFPKCFLELSPTSPLWASVVQIWECICLLFLAQARRIMRCSLGEQPEKAGIGRRLARVGGARDQPPGAQGNHSSPEVLFQPWEQALLQAQVRP